MLRYPVMLPLTEVQLLIAILRDRAVVEQKVKFFKAFWISLGFGFKTVVGEDPDDAGNDSLFGASIPATRADLEELFAACTEAQSFYGGLTLDARPGKLGDGKFIKLFLQYAPQLLSLLALFLDKPEDESIPADEVN